MYLGVVPDHVSGRDDRGGRGGEVALEHADLEERRRDTVALEDREDLRRVGTGPVVEGQGNLAVLGPGDADVGRVDQGAVNRRVLGGGLTRHQRPGARTGELADHHEEPAWVRAGRLVRDGAAATG